MSVFLDLIHTLGWLPYAAITDTIALPTRVLSVVEFAGLIGTGPPTFMFGETTGILATILASGSTILVVGGAWTLLTHTWPSIETGGCIPLVRSICVAGGAILCFDGAMQLGSVFDPKNSLFSFAYPTSRTGFFPLFQIVLGVDAMLLGVSGESHRKFGSLTECLLKNHRMPAAAAAFSFRYMAEHNRDPNSSGSVLFYSAGVIAGLYTVTPGFLLEALGHALVKGFTVLAQVSAAVYAFFEQLVPKIRQIFVDVMQHRALVAVYTTVVEPLWCAVSPLVLPTATAAVAISCSGHIIAIASATAGGNADAMQLGFRMNLPPSWLLDAAGYAACGLSATVSTVVLWVHAGSKLRGLQRYDPLANTKALKLLHGCSYVLQIPMMMCTKALLWSSYWCEVIVRLLEPVFTVVFKMLEFIINLMSTTPTLGILIVVAFNVVIFKSFARDGADTVVQLIGMFVQYTPEADGTFALMLTATVQIAAYRIVHHRLRRVSCFVPIVVDGRGATGVGDAVAPHILNQIATTMRDPLMCGSCGFGPVDHHGCSDLNAHHRYGEASNSCPRCGWFVHSLASWPPWDDRAHTVEGMAAVRIISWNDTVVVLRAAAKALVVPFGLLQLGSRYRLQPAMSAALALSYLVPWIVVNSHTALDLYKTRTQRPRRPRQRHHHHRQHGPQDVDANDTADADCGAEPAREAQPTLPTLTEVEAVRVVLGAIPSRVFLSVDDICSICLETFEAAAAVAAQELTGEDCASALSKLDPSVVGLRCGHPLHSECARSAIANSTGWHMRCPLCREPVTAAGAASARAFS